MTAELVGKYVSTRGAHWSGALWEPQLRAIERLCPSRGTTIETGCGASTILFSQLSRHHTVFTHDDRNHENSSVRFATESPLFRAATVEFIFGPTQLTLPAFKFERKIDAALIDGPHAFPFAELEYYYIYPHLTTGGILMVDDVHIPTLFNLYRFLREEKMFMFLDKISNTAFFRRTNVPTFDPLGDGWDQQYFNLRRFPAIGRDERFASYFPKWLTKLFPHEFRQMIKARLLLRART